MKLTTLALLVAATACATETDSETTASLATGFVHREGTRIIGNDGQPLVLRGVNLGGWLMQEGWIMGGVLLGSGNGEQTIHARLTELYGAAGADQFRERFRDAYITEADIARIAELGFNSVRVPFNHDHLDLARLDAVLDWGEAHGVYVILDLHAAPGGQCNSFVADPDPVLLWQSAVDQAETVAMWTQLATRYRDRRWLAGYDLLNEPCSVTDAQLAAFMERLARAVRSVDPNHAVIVEGNRSGTDFTGFTRRFDDNLIYSFHYYRVGADRRAQLLADYQALSTQQQVPLWCGEFGEDDLAFERSTVQMLGPYGISGFALWTWKQRPTGKVAPEEVAISPAWSAVIDWVTAPKLHRKPGVIEAALGRAQYLAAVPLAANSEHAEVAAALLE